MKHEWRKKEKDIYIAKLKPSLIDLPPMKYITIEGEGNPNGPLFSACIEALYALSYGIKMTLKKEADFDGYYDYTVYPLEGFWSLTEEGIKLYEEKESVIDIKDHLSFKLMIRQPDFVTTDFFESIKEKTYAKKEIAKILDTKFETITEGKCAQIRHLGSYDTEPASFEILERYLKENKLERLNKNHKEIYLSDARRVAPEKLKTTLRVKIK